MSRLSSTRVRRAAIGAALAVAATTAGTAANLAPATSAPSSACPEAFPVSDVVKGQAVTGLTVTSGTTPEEFTGTVIGRLSDGIAPGVDMIMMDLTSPEIDRVGGIWQGMSGSPVYAEDGRLIGAVAYGLSWGATPVAGITPYDAMREELPTAPAQDAEVPAAMQQRIVASGDATAAQADSGMEIGDIPMGVSGFTRPARLQRAAKKFDFATKNVYRMGAASANADASVDEIVPGGNIAATISYGDVTAGGVGTATAVCGTDVLAFGHPAFFAGPTTMTMHGADALYVQKDTLGAPFKVANIGAGTGEFTRDGLTAIGGTLGTLPGTTDVTSLITDSERDRSRTGATHISVQDAVPDIAASHLLVNGDRVFDGIRGGSAVGTWTVNGTREDGTPWSFIWADHYSNGYDLTFDVPYTLYDQLATLQYSTNEDFTIDDVNASLDLSDQQRAWHIARAEVRRHGDWVNMRRRAHILASPGSTLRLRVSLTSDNEDLGTRSVRQTIRVPRTVKGQEGQLQVAGGQYFYYGGFFYRNSPSFDAALEQVTSRAHNDQLVVSLDLFARRGHGTHKERRSSTEAVVTGHKSIQLGLVPRRR